MTPRLNGRTAVVTGGSNGIGRAIALGYAAEGAAIVVNDISEKPQWDGDGSTGTVEEIRSQGGKATFVKGDISDSDAVDALFDTTRREFGRIDIVVNNAAIFTADDIEHTSGEMWDNLMRINLRGQFLVAKRAINDMLAQEAIREVRGRLINTSSQHGMVGAPSFLAYSVAKGGTVNMTRQLAVDYGKHGIIVNALAPGRILVRHTSEEDAAAEDPTIAYSRSRTPFHRLGRPQDLVGPAVFLASDECSYVSGHNLLVDGGWMAY